MLRHCRRRLCSAPFSPPSGGSYLRTWQTGVVVGLGVTCGVGALIYLLRNPFHSDTVQLTTNLATETLNDARVREQAVQLTREVLTNILHDTSSVHNLAVLIPRLLQQREVRDSVGSFLNSIFEDIYVQEVTKQFVLKIVKDKWVRDQLHDITVDLTIQLLNNPKVREELTQLLVESSKDALRKSETIDASAQAVRSTVVKAITPWR